MCWCKLESKSEYDVILWFFSTSLWYYYCYEGDGAIEKMGLDKKVLIVTVDNAFWNDNM